MQSCRLSKSEISTLGASIPLFNPLSYALQLEAAGVSRHQAQVHAQVLQNVYDEEHRQYPTKADMFEMNRRLEEKFSFEIAGVKGLIDGCKKEMTEVRADVASLKTSNKYLLWIGGGLATFSASSTAMCLTMLMQSLK
jgi:hypothetical protein